MVSSEFQRQKELSILEHIGRERNPISVYGKSVASERHPERNEDAMLVMQERSIFGVFDGIGGYAGGDKASRIAKDIVGRTLQRLPERPTLQQAQTAVSHSLMEAHEAVLNEGEKEMNNMATTASLLLMWNGPGEERKAIIGNVGDSRVYLLRERKLEQVTIDDNGVHLSLPNENDARQLQAKLNNTVDPERELTRNEQDLFHSRNEITQALGFSEPIEPRITTIDLLPNDRLLVCSDGISDNLTDREVQTIMESNPAINVAVQKLIEASQTRSRTKHPRAKPDDMTALIVDVGTNQRTK